MNELTKELRPPHSGSSPSLKQIDLLDAAWLFLAVQDSEMQTAIETVRETNPWYQPLYQSLPVAQSGQVVVVDGALRSGAAGMLATDAMLDDIERIPVRGDVATPPA